MPLGFYFRLRIGFFSPSRCSGSCRWFAAVVMKLCFPGAHTCYIHKTCHLFAFFVLQHLHPGGSFLLACCLSVGLAHVVFASKRWRERERDWVCEGEGGRLAMLGFIKWFSLSFFSYFILFFCLSFFPSH